MRVSPLSGTPLLPLRCYCTSVHGCVACIQDDAADPQSDLVLSGLRCLRCVSLCVPSLPVVDVPTPPPCLLAASLCAYGMDVCDTTSINRVISGVELGDDWQTAVDATLLCFKCPTCEVAVDDPSIAMQVLHAIAELKASTSEPYVLLLVMCYGMHTVPIRVVLCSAR